MRSYEIIYIVHPDLDENAFKEVTDKVNGWITTAGGEIEKEDLWGKMQLAYRIRKQKEGHYVFLLAKLPPEFNTELEKNMRFLEPVLRHMIIVVE